MSDTLIVPDSITNFERSILQKETFVVFALCVAGKNAHQTAVKVDQFMRNIIEETPDPKDEPPFTFMDRLFVQGTAGIRHHLEKVKMGQYTRLTKALWSFAQIPYHQWMKMLTEGTPHLAAFEERMGKKSSRFFLMHTFEGVNYAALDTHILKFLASKGYDVPKSTPADFKKYREIEEWFVLEAQRAGKTVADFDLEVWKSYRIKHGEEAAA